MIKIENVTKKFGGVTALDDLSLTVEGGSVFGLVGSNGSGKSTLLRVIAGVLKPERGQVLIDGENSFENTEVKGRCFFVSDFPFFYSDSTVENLAQLYSRLYPDWSAREFERMCGVFPIDKKAKIISMSKGMQRQAALILALSARPEYLLLDEIFDGLDPVIRQLLKKLLMEGVAQRAMTVIIASHNLRELEDVCDHVGLLHGGGVVLERELDELKLGIHKVQAVFAAVPDADAFGGLDIVSSERRGSLFKLVIKGDNEDIMRRLNMLCPVFLESLPLTLEEVFISEMEAAGYDIDNILKK